MEKWLYARDTLEGVPAELPVSSRPQRYALGPIHRTDHGSSAGDMVAELVLQTLRRVSLGWEVCRPWLAIGSRPKPFGFRAHTSSRSGKPGPGTGPYDGTADLLARYVEEVPALAAVAFAR